MKRQWRKGSVSGRGGRRRRGLWLFCHEMFVFQVLLFGACLLLVVGSEARSLTQQAAQSRGQFDNDVMGLLTFKRSSVMSDPNGFLSSWIQTNSSNPCSWRGVSCSSNGYVVALNLTQAGLIGPLILSNLTSSLPYLTSLDLSGNLFSSGDLSFGSVTSCNLQTLDLSSNNLSSPFNLTCNSLLYLDVSGNQISAGSTFLSQTLTNCQNLILFNVSSNKVSGNLPSVLSSSRNLSALDLSHNLLSGNIPPSFLVDGPASLAYLDLSRNNFSGLLSSFEFGDCGKLTLLNMSHNILAGNAFPTSLSNCSVLETLDLSGNRLQGNIPGGLLGNSLKNLRSLSLAHNQFFGDIPPELGNICGSLEELDLSGNKLIGGLPQTFASCASLRNLNLERNQLSGDFIDTVISNLPNLTYLYLAFNNISSAFPVSVTNITQLRLLDLSSNKFTGNIPSGFCSSSSASPFLVKLKLANNFLTGTVPAELGNCNELSSFDFSFNDLSGSIPLEVWSLPKLSDVIAWANRLSGEIPEDICVNGGNLEMLILNNNFITGHIPQSIGSCINLIWVSLSSNRITGLIPSSIGNLPNLAILQLGNNSISGPIPPKLGNCKSLVWLDLNSNNLTGSIPPELADQTGMVVLVPGIVSGKQFAFVRNEGGTACRGAGGLIEFEGVRADRLESHPMVHTCPSTRVYTGLTVYTFASNGSLMYLDLSYNDLSGSIPDNYGPMIYLQVLNLGHNDLTGTIPDKLGDLKSIGVLDLSHNHLQGSIPGSLTSPSFLSDFDVSNNNLSGPIPSGGQLFTFPASRYENNSGLCGLPLPPCGSGTGTAASFMTRGKMSMAKLMVVAVMVSLFFIVGLSLALCRMNQNQQNEIKAEKSIESLPTSGSSTWKLSSVPEPLSINVATFEKPLRKLTFADLLEATNGFSANSLIGAGGFGEVYKAQLKDGCTVAIKKLVHVTGQGDREFMAEMETIGKIKHRNLVPLLGYCKIGEERLLVYEYMKWGSLDSVLHDRVKSGAPRLDWPTRKKIVIGSARGLAFLHHSCIPHIIHRDMKSSNVLLDEDLVARVSDFGLARLVNALDTHLSVSTLAGTPGYVPPEYYQSFRCTAKGDVYSYGVILLELLSGKRPIDTSAFGDDNNIVGWAKQLQKENRANEILDPELMRSESGEAERYHYLKIAFNCLDDRPFRRPTMIQVMAMFKELQMDTENDHLDGFTLKDIYETRDKN